MPVWRQTYDPFSFWPLSTFVSALPVLTLFFVLIVLKSRVWVAALSGMTIAIVLALCSVTASPSRRSSA
jgi:L-lactate permease